MGITDIIVYSISLTIFAIMIVLLMRYPLRYLYHLARTSKFGTGGMFWYEVIYSGNSNINELRKGKDQASNMANLMGGKMNSSFLPIYWNRGLTSAIIRKDADGQVRMYIGIDAKHHNESAINVWASKANCTAEPIDFKSIGFVSKAPMIAVNRGMAPSKFDDVTIQSTPGSVVSAIQETIKDERSGSLLISFEPMRSQKSELGLLSSHVVNTDMKLGGGDAVALSGISRQMNIFRSNNPSRGVIMAFSDDGDYETSNSIITNSMNAIPNLGINYNINSAMQINRNMGLYGIAVSALFSVIAFFGIINWVMPIILIALSVATLLGLPILSEKWVELCSQNGEAAIPVFWRYSIRRKLREFVLDINPTDIDSGNISSKDYVAEPSCKEVMYFYSTSAMQIISMPTSVTQASNIYTSPIPPVALDRSINKKLKHGALKTDDVVLIGTSAKSHEMVCRTIDDINFGLAFGGAPGSGKTNALRNDFYGVSRLARKTTGKAAEYYINPIWFETKSGGLEKLVELTEEFKPKVFPLHDGRTKFRISLEGKRIGDTVKDKNTKQKREVTIDEILQYKNGFLSAMKAVLGTTSFGPRSEQIADSALTVAMLLTERDARSMGIFNKLVHTDVVDTKGNKLGSKDEGSEKYLYFRPNIMKLMTILLGADTTLPPIVKDLEKLLAELNPMLYPSSDTDGAAKFQELVNSEGREPQEIRERLEVMTGALSGLISGHKADNGKAVQPLWNKIPKFQESAGLFETVTPDGVARREFDIRKLYTFGGPVIIDMTSQGSNMSESDTRMFTMMVHYMLWQSIQKYCSGWGETYNRYIPLYVDELVNFTGSATDKSLGECSEVVGEIKNQGRSYGTSHNVGFQQFEQLPGSARSSVLSFETLVLFKLKNSSDRDTAINQIGDNTMYAPENFTYLPQGVGIASSMLIDGKDTRPFTVITPFDQDWKQALSSSKTVEEGFTKIRNKEVSKIREERKKRISRGSGRNNRNTHQDDYEEETARRRNDDIDEDAGYGYIDH